VHAGQGCFRAAGIQLVLVHTWAVDTAEEQHEPNRVQSEIRVSCNKNAKTSVRGQFILLPEDLAIPTIFEHPWFRTPIWLEQALLAVASQ
jgi:hypothetical protein